MTTKQLLAADAKFAKADALREEARTARNAAIRAAVAEGRSQVEVARLLGLTKARVNSIVKGGT
jgi:predicted XRE-type DNA-binding protein